MSIFSLSSSSAEFFAGLAILVAVIRYGTYFWSIYKKETKPHVFSWFNWGLVTGIAAFAQYELDGGPSSWVLFFVAATCLILAVFALFIGEKNITKTDWIAFIGALLAIPVWQATNNPMAAIMIVILIDILAYYPTIRKSWTQPYQEPPGSYFWAGLRYFLTLFAIPEPTLSSLLYPFFLMAIDWGFAIYLLWRRRVIGRTGAAEED